MSEPRLSAAGFVVHEACSVLPSAAPEGGQGGLPALFEAVARRFPEAIAIRDGRWSITYAELNARANRLARRLLEAGPVAGRSVGICLERCLEFPLSALAILKAGGSYLPLDPGNPPERLQSMLEDARARVVLTRGGPALSLPAQVRRIDLETFAGQEGDGSDLEFDVAGEDVAYVMFTSGSTGKPKGAEITHRGIASLVQETNYIEFTPHDVVAYASNPAFDASTFEIWGALLHGACLTVVERETLLSPPRLQALLQGQGITVLLLTTPLFHAMAREIPGAFGGLRYLLTGGDALDPTAARRVVESATPPQNLLNAYGPTEITTLALFHRVTEVPPGTPRIPIGRPIARSSAYVLDEHLRPVAAGTPGELFLGGPGLARGYVSAPAQTAERFRQTPWGRLYQTGDLARELPDGSLDFLGRKDQQVKFRGYRIELTEIEAAIRRVASTGECRVLAREVSPGERQIIAYVTRNCVPLLPVAEIRTGVSRILPEYMVPASIIEVPRFPLTSNGKLAVEELPLSTPAAPAAASLPEAPTTLHTQLIEIWQEVLERRPLGLRDDFFESGGHSLLAIRMLSLVEQRLGVRPTLTTLFEEATIEHLAEAILGDLQATAREQPYAAMHAEGKQTPFFFLHGDFAGGGFFCRGLAEAMGPDRPFYAIHPHGLQGDRPPRSIAVMAAERLAVIRQLQPHGPYLLGGYCNGALVAFEIARLLEAEGEPVPTVILLMADGSNYRHRHWQNLADLVGALFGEPLLQREQRFLRWSRRATAASASLRHHWAAAQRMLHESGEDGVRRIMRKVRRFLEPSPARSTVAPPLNQEQEFWDLYHDASQSYVPSTFGGKLVLLWPSEEPARPGFHPAEGWESVSPEVELRLVPGTHDSSITRRAHLALVGEEIRCALEGIAPAPVALASPLLGMP